MTQKLSHSTHRTKNLSSTIKNVEIYFIFVLALYKELQKENIFFCLFVLKFPGPGSNLYHSSNPRYNSDNARSLTHWATRELQE